VKSGAWCSAQLSRDIEQGNVKKSALLRAPRCTRNHQCMVFIGGYPHGTLFHHCGLRGMEGSGRIPIGQE
jgi:hypothetical protein